MLKIVMLASSLLIIACSVAHGDSILVGDKDGFGIGVPTNGNLPFNGNTPQDDRSATEKLATNGAQLTDIYSSLEPPPAGGVGGTTTGNVIFGLPSAITAGTLTVGMGDFQASTFGQINVSYNGVLQPNLFNFEDGLNTTQTRTFTLNPSALSAANGAGALIVNLDRGSSTDYVDFDYFQFDYTPTASSVTPEPSTLVLLGTGLLGAAGAARRNFL